MCSYPTEVSTNGASLTVKQQRFVEEYCVDFNATQAAIRAGYAKSGASVEGFRLLRNAKIAKSIEERLALFGLTPTMALKKLSDIVREPTAGQPSVSEQISAIDKILRAHGAYLMRHEHAGLGGKDLGPFRLEIVNQPRHEGN